MMSPGHASSASSRSRAKNNIGLCTASSLPVRDCFSFMPRRKRPEHSRRKATRSRWLRVHVGLDLEDEAGDLAARPARPARGSAGCGARRRREFGQRRAAVRARRNCCSALPKNTGVRWPCADRPRGRMPGSRPRHLDAPRAASRAASSADASASADRRARHLHGSPSSRRVAVGGRTAAARRRADRSMPRKSRPMPIGQLAGAGVERQRSAAISSSSSNGSRRLAVHLVDEGDDRHVAQAADLEQLAGLRLDALGRVDHHDRAVDRGQRAVGVLGEILVARRVEQVEDAPVILERHHRGGDRDAALALDLHPVRARAPRARRAPCTSPGQLDRAAEQQQLLGQRRLAGVGVRDDREGPPPARLGGDPGRRILDQGLGSSATRATESTEQGPAFARGASPPPRRAEAGWRGQFRPRRGRATGPERGRGPSLLAATRSA